MQNSTLNSRAAAEAKLDGDFKLQHFTYNNPSILEVLDFHLRNTDFLGISVRQAKPKLCDCNITAYLRFT